MVGKCYTLFFGKTGQRNPLPEVLMTFIAALRPGMPLTAPPRIAAEPQRKRIS